MDQNIKELYLKHQSTRKVAKLTGLSTSTVSKKLEKLGILNKQQRITKIKTNDKLLIATYIGIWAGDGCRFYRKGYYSKIHLHKDNKLLSKFISKIIYDLFGKETHMNFDGRNRASIRTYSKFIHDFPENYLNLGKNKTKTVHLKKIYSKQFLRGFLLGLMLTDGYLKIRFTFVTISKKLSEQVIEILKRLELDPKLYIHKRAKYGWNDLYMINLKKEQSRKSEEMLNATIKDLNFTNTFRELKNYE